MVVAARDLRQYATHFLKSETGTVTVDWAVMTSMAAIAAVATSGALVASTDSFTSGAERILKSRVAQGSVSESEQERLIGSGLDGNGDPIPFGFAGASHNVSTTTSNFNCEPGASSTCGRSGETQTQQFVMTDGTIWTRSTTSFSDSNNNADDVVTWLDHTGREATDIPELPNDIPVVVIN